MEVTIKAIKFEASDRLMDFTKKKMSKLDKFFDRAISATVAMKVTKPESVANKEAEITINAPNTRLFASKTADTFEQAVDECVSALEKQIEKSKNK